MTIAERLAEVRAGIPSGVRLVAVSKTQPAAAIREAHAAGQRDFGENYAQEWRAKAEALADLPDLVWHFIGSLQTNKVKVLVRPGRAAPHQAEPGAGEHAGIHWIHTVDREDLAREISKRALQRGVLVRVLIEVNVAREASKSGCDCPDVPRLAELVATLPGVELRGLMCIPPAEGDPRPHFAVLRGLRDRLSFQLPDLSMGMSGDYREAIAEGSTIVRVGTAIFGPRPTGAGELRPPGA